jgi:hypothetical protein
MANIKHSYAVYNSCGQFFARFTSYSNALRWAVRNGVEWSAEIRKEKEKTHMPINTIEDAMQRIDEMIAQDKKTGEHPNATLADYIGWATEEIKLNK